MLFSFDIKFDNIPDFFAELPGYVNANGYLIAVVRVAAGDRSEAYFIHTSFHNSKRDVDRLRTAVCGVRTPCLVSGSNPNGIPDPIQIADSGVGPHIIFHLFTVEFRSIRDHDHNI
ncbi:hypothetical protein D3C73_1216620 [compost metagenome]